MGRVVCLFLKLAREGTYDCTPASTDARASGARQVVDFVLESAEQATPGDLICGFPTGYGKSVCYALPALHLEAVVLVISPLCSLIHDQTTALNARVGAQVALNLSGMGADQDLALLRAHEAGALLVFTTPERLQVEWFMQDLRALHSRQVGSCGEAECDRDDACAENPAHACTGTCVTTHGDLEE